MVLPDKPLAQTRFMLACKNVSSGYNGTDVIHDVSVSIESGEMFCVAGSNGCGKSTLLKTVSAMLPYRGSVTIDGVEVSAIARKELAKKIALLTQMSHVYFPYTVYDTVALSRYVYSSAFFKTISAEDAHVVDTVIHELELDAVKDRMLDELSGGQLQRVYLARTIAQEPDIILLDEPTNHLDLKHQIELLEYLGAWVKTHNKCVIGALHDLNLSLSFFGKTMLMKEGRMLWNGQTETLFSGDKLREVYGADVRGFMLRSLEKWQRCG